MVSDASNPTLTITLAGTATVAGQLGCKPGSLSFGSVVVGQSKSLTATLTATGSSITVSDAGMTTSEFTISGLSLPLTLRAGQSASFTVNFKPQSSGAASASGTFSSNAANASLTQALSGTGTPAPQHSVALSWNPSASSVVGYNVYRGITTGGPVFENHFHECGHHLRGQLGSVRPDLFLRHHGRGRIRQGKRKLQSDPGCDPHSLGT